MISGGHKEADLFLKECIFGKHKCTIFSPFSAKVYTYIRFWGLQGGSVPLPIGKFCICKLNMHIFRPFFGLNLQKYIISGGHKGQPLFFFIRECVFRRNHKCSPFSVKMYTYVVARGGAPLPKKIILQAKYA